MRSEIEKFLSAVSPKTMKWYSKARPQAIEALTIVDTKLPSDEPILALSFGHGDYSDGGLLVVTDRRLLYVGGEVQSWRLEEIDRVGSNGKDILAIKPRQQQDTSTFGGLTNGPEFITALNGAVNNSKFSAI